MQKNYGSNWKRPGMHSNDYSFTRDHNHDRRSFASTEDYRGVGPLGYKKSDDKIREHVCELLLWNPDVDATDIDVTVQDGVVYLKGFVDSRHSKRTAERIIDHLSGVKDVQNQLILKQNLDVEEDKIIARGDDGLFTQEIQKK
jgi:HSP20 family molecular chaperone IbpA